MDQTIEVMTSVDQCLTCDVGTFCPVGSAAPSPCTTGTYNDQKRKEGCIKCPAGFFQNMEGGTACKTCEGGSYCTQGTAVPTPCPAGTFGHLEGLEQSSQCTKVAPGEWSALGSTEPTACGGASFFCEVCTRCEKRQRVVDTRSRTRELGGAGGVCQEGARTGRVGRGE
jgi:hypothetical protein